MRLITALPHAPLGRPFEGFGRFWPDRRLDEHVTVWRLPTVMARHDQPVAAGLVTRAIGNGTACGAGRPDQLAAALSDLLADPEARAARGAGGRAYAEAHYSKRLRHERWEHLLMAVVNPPGPAHRTRRVDIHALSSTFPGWSSDT
jgi:hypothetical protein